METGIIFLNFIYSVCGLIVALVFMIFGYKIFDYITPFDTSKELDDKNVAVGIVIGCMFIGLSITAGLVIGLSLN